LDGRLGGPQSRSGCCGVEKNLASLPGIQPRSLAITTELSQVLEVLYQQLLSSDLGEPAS
jgi:hypothetical protein